MFKVTHTTLIFLSGFVWLIVGCFLLPLGLNFVIESLLQENSSLPHPILNFFAPYLGGIEPAALLLIALALVIGFLKGKRIFAKSVQRSVDRIRKLPNPASLSKIYTPGYYLLLGSMIFLGILVRYTTQDIRGGVDIAVGTALVTGAMLYFKQAWLVSKQSFS